MKSDNRLYFPATQKNKEVIRKAIKNFLPKNGYVLEIGSGSGEHGVFFQEIFPNIIWQTRDPNAIYRRSINSWIKQNNFQFIMPKPLDINVEQRPWLTNKKLITKIKCIVSINMIHIAPWSATKALFEESKSILKKNKNLILYGPFKSDGLHTSKSNKLFDQSLKIKNKNWGIRDLRDICNLALETEFNLIKTIKMPSNNLTLILKRIN